MVLFYLKGQYIGLTLPHSQLDLGCLLFLLSPRFSLSQQGSVWPSFPKDLAADRQIARVFQTTCCAAFPVKKSPWPSLFLKQRKHNNTCFSLPREVSSVLFHKGPFRNQSKRRSPGQVMS